MSNADIDRALNAEVPDRANALIALREGQWYDRKSLSISGVKLAESIVGFANAEGGVIVLGLRDGIVEDIDKLSSKDRRALEQAATLLCDPPVRARHSELACIDANGNGRTLLVLHIPAGETVHETVAGDCYLRVADSTLRQSSLQTQELRFDKGNQHYETTRCHDATLDDLDHDLLSNYASSLGSTEPHQVLEDRTLSRGQRLTVSAVLLFGKRPTRFYPNALVRVTRYQGRERTVGADQRIVDDVMFEEAIPRLILNAQKKIRELQPTRNALNVETATFEDVPLVPEDAWLEGLVNAVVHRSYSLDGDHIHVDIFDDRIEITSPGRFPGAVSLDNVEAIRRFARNQRIVRVCFDMKICKEMGEGIKRIFKEMRDADLDDPLYQQTSMSVTLTLSAEPRHRLLDKIYHSEAAEVLAALRSTQRLSTGELADRLRPRSRQWVIDLLQAMRSARLIDWHGKSKKDPRAYWSLPDTR